MTEFTAEDGCPTFRAIINLDDSQIGQTFRWGVSVDTQQRSNVWGIPTEVNDVASTEALSSGADQRKDQYACDGGDEDGGVHRSGVSAELLEVSAEHADRAVQDEPGAGRGYESDGEVAQVLPAQ